MPLHLKHPRLLACARCFRLKRKCDHAKPMCGECRRRGTECLPMKSRKDGQDITIPLEYLKQLESRIAELDRPSAATHDVGVQTDFSTQQPDPHPTTLSGMADSAPGGLHPAAQQVFGTPDDYPQNDLLRHVAASEQDLLRVSDMRSHAPRLEGALISRLAYEVYPDRPGWDFYAGTDAGSPHAGYPFWQEEVYANLYFSITHWVWPFLDSGAWKTWRQEWNSDSEADQWKGFLVKMVLAIGALSCNVLQPSQGHSAHAADLYTAAMAYYPYVMGHESSILQIQASILMVLYALQCPSAEEISTAVSSIVPFCTATVADMRKHAAAGNGVDLGLAGGEGEILTETLFITCFMLNEIVVSGWDRPVSASYRAIDDDVYSLGNEVPSSSSTSTALRHLFRLRKIQADIRRQWREESGQPQANDTMLKSALDTWRNEIPRYGVEEAPSTYLHPLWMANLYDYSVIIMMQEKRDTLQPGDIEDVVTTSDEVCRNFRRLQEEGQVMCYTWSALVFQFRAGITLLYIFWVTPREPTLVQRALEALYICADNVSHHADRWPDATPYAKIMDFLFQSASWIPAGSPRSHRSACSREELPRHLTELKKQYLHKAVLRMIEDMLLQ